MSASPILRLECSRLCLHRVFCRLLCPPPDEDDEDEDEDEDDAEDEEEDEEDDDAALSA